MTDINNGANELARQLATLMDKMKDDRDGLNEVLTISEMSKYTGGLRKSAIAALIAEGKFPSPIKLSSRRNVWLKSEILSWQLGRIAAARGKRERLA
jgi:prophage regulatory protein